MTDQQIGRELVTWLRLDLAPGKLASEGWWVLPNDPDHLRIRRIRVRDKSDPFVSLGDGFVCQVRRKIDNGPEEFAYQHVLSAEMVDTIREPAWLIESLREAFDHGIQAAIQRQRN